MPEVDALRAPMNWGERIKVARDASGMSQAALGKAIGKSQVTVGEYEREESEPTLGIFQKIAKATGYQYAWLVVGSGAPKEGGNADESDIDKDTISQCIIVAERIMSREGHHYSPEEKAALIFAGHAVARKEGGAVAVERVFERMLAAAKSVK